MAVTITAAQVKTFENTVRHLAQQQDSRLRAWCQEKDITSASHSFKRMGKRALASKAARRTATPVNDAAWSNRVAIPAPYDDGDTYESEEAAAMIISPASELTTAMGYAVKRMYDDIIINAADADAVDETGAVNAFPAAQLYTGSAAYADEFDMKAITAIGEIFNTNDVPPEEPKCAVIGPKQLRKLQHEDKVGNSLYKEQLGALATNGFLRSWLGFDWILSNRLLKPQAQQIKCLFMTRRAMGLLVTEDLFARVGEDASVSFLTRVYVKITAGAVRVEDEQIVVAQMKDLATIA